MTRKWESARYKYPSTDMATWKTWSPRESSPRQVCLWSAAVPRAAQACVYLTKPGKCSSWLRSPPGCQVVRFRSRGSQVGTAMASWEISGPDRQDKLSTRVLHDEHGDEFSMWWHVWWRFGTTYGVWCSGVKGHEKRFYFMSFLHINVSTHTKECMKGGTSSCERKILYVRVSIFFPH